MADNVIIYLTGTGNSYYAAIKLRELLGYDEVLPAPLVLDRPSVLGNPVRVGLVFPTYYGMPPKNLGPLFSNVLSDPALDRIEYLFAVTTCGLGPGYSLKICEQLAMDSRIICSYSGYVRMPDTYALLLKVPPEEKQKQIFAAADLKIGKMADEIREMAMRIPPYRPGSNLMIRKYIRYCNSETQPRITVDTRLCVSCGICEAVCPRDAVTIENGHPVFSTNCENCLACYHFCPQKAILLKGRKPSAQRYGRTLTGYNPDYRQGKL